MKINTANTISSIICFLFGKSPVLIAANHFVRRSEEESWLCSQWVDHFLGNWRKLRPGSLLSSFEQPRMRQNEDIACYCMTVFAPPRWQGLLFSDVIVIRPHNMLFSRCLVPLIQNKSKCATFDMENGFCMQVQFYANQSHFQRMVSHLGLGQT